MMDGMLSTYLEQVKDRVNSCEEFYELQQQQWQESIRLRTEEGIVKTIAGVGTMILGGILIVATCGMALPLVTTVGVAAIGLGTAAYGCANAVEGGQDVYAGVTGDPRRVSVNPIRDTLFASNPDLYYLIGNTLTISASLLLTGGMAANAAISAGTSIGRAVVTGYAKQGLTMAASSYVEKSMTEEAIQGIQASDLVSMVPVPELKQQEDTTIPLDISDYTEENAQLIQAVDSAYRENLSEASAQLSDLRTAGNELVSSLKEISEGVGKINLLSDADGQLLYRDGIRNLQDTLLAYNGVKTAEQNSRLAQIAQIQNVTEQLDTNLQQCIENYNQRIEAAGIQNLNSYGREMKAQLPKLQWKEAEAEDGTVAYELTCSQVEGMEEPPVITIALEQNAIEENVKNKNYIDKILKAFLLPEDSDGGDGEEDKTGEGEKTEEDKNGEEKTGEDKTEEGKTEEGEKNEPESGEGEDTGEEPEAAVTVEKIFEQCDADTEIMEFLTEQGYASTKEFLKAYLDGEVPVAQTETQLKVTGDVDALGEYLKASLEQIATEDYTLPVFEGSWQTGDGSRMGFRDLLRDTGLLCDAMQTDVAAQKNVDVDGITGLVQSGCIQPLADRTDFVKKEIENSQKEEQDAVNSYQRSVNGFHPRQDTTVMNDSVSSMRENAALMQQEINTSNQSYVDYADKLYQTTSENILTLQQHIEEAKETSNQAVTDALASAKEVKNTTSSQNQTALADFAAKLPYTRVGSMEYTQVYEFVAQPTQMLQVSDYQRLKDEVDHTVSQKSVTGSREQQKSSRWVEYLLYGILGILAVGILGSYARSYHRRIKEQSNPSKDVAI